MSSSRSAPVPSRTGVKSMMTVPYLSPRRGVPSHVLIDAEHLDPVKAARIGDQHAAAFGEDSVVGGVPRHRRRFGDPDDRDVLAERGLQRPPQSTPGQLGARFDCPAVVLAPHMSAAAAAVAATSTSISTMTRPPPLRP